VRQWSVNQLLKIYLYMKLAQSYRDLEIYKAAFRFQQALFEASKMFPKSETYALTDQIRRSSRSIGANLSEGWSKRRYEAHFLSKLTDCDGELQETTHWLRTAFSCTYLTSEQCAELMKQAEEIGRMLGAMMARHTDFCFATAKSKSREVSA
jgi:four helix bundle protein